MLLLLDMRVRPPDLTFREVVAMMNNQIVEQNNNQQTRGITRFLNKRQPLQISEALRQYPFERTNGSVHIANPILWPVCIFCHHNTRSLVSASSLLTKPQFLPT